MELENNRLGGFNPNVGTFGVKKKRPENTEGMKVEEQKVQPDVRPSEKSKVPANDVLSFMANSSVYNAVVASKKIDVSKFVAPEQRERIVSKFVTPEQQERIAGSIRDFENKVTKNFNEVTEEIPGVNQSTAMLIALDMIERVSS